jgi:hypothetical protein
MVAASHNLAPLLTFFPPGESGTTIPIPDLILGLVTIVNALLNRFTSTGILISPIPIPLKLALELIPIDIFILEWMEFVRVDKAVLGFEVIECSCMNKNVGLGLSQWFTGGVLR